MDVLLDSGIDDCWKVDGDRNISEPWTGITQFTILNEKPPDGYTWPGRRLTKVQATSRPDHLWPEILSGISVSSQPREKQQWAIEKPKPDNARKLGGIYVIDPEDMEFKETRKNAREKLELPLDSAIPCKVQIHQRREFCGDRTDTGRSKYACIVEAHESTRKRSEGFIKSLQSCAQVCHHASSNDKYRMRKQRWTKKGKSSINCQHRN